MILKIQLQNINFLYILFCLLIPSVFFLFALSWKTRINKNFDNSGLIKEIKSSYSSKLFKLKFFIVLISLGLLGITSANPRKKLNNPNTIVKSIDIMFALDVSKSMLSEDIKPSRLEAGKQIVSRLIKLMNNDRFGLIVFGGKPFLQMPLTTDLTAASMYVNGISVDAVPEQGTAIGNALTLADNSLNTNEKKYKAIILISDGEDHDSTARDAAKQAYNHGTIIFSIGVGSKEGAPIKEEGADEYKKDEKGSVIISKLNETLLREIAETTKGKYYSVSDAELVIPSIISDINSLEKKSFKSNNNSDYTSFFWVFLSLAIFLLLAEVFIPEVKKKYFQL